MKMIAAAAMLLLLAGCEKPEVKALPSVLQRQLAVTIHVQAGFLSIQDRSTSVAELKSLMGDRGAHMGRNPGLRIVSTTSDAANAYGTPVRSTDICAFVLNNGKLDESRIDSALSMAKGQRALHDMMSAGMVSAVSHSA